ncbi:hypothetical protein [Peterkaempfera sp. SMS 1(5)a]|uniref:hypothetical protein n=1 Tax=Peterkaempfera podocarpi TaxID=3232308 RepID=UPI00366F3362
MVQADESKIAGLVGHAAAVRFLHDAAVYINRKSGAFSASPGAEKCYEQADEDIPEFAGNLPATSCDIPHENSGQEGFPRTRSAVVNEVGGRDSRALALPDVEQVL